MGVRLAALTALAGFCAFHWSNLVTNPPVTRVVATVAIAAAVGLALSRLAAHREPGSATAAAALAIAVVGVAAGLLAMGLSPHLIAPGGWDRLADGVGRGLVGVGDVTYPFDGGAGWPRLVILLALPVLLTASAALAFWPARRHGDRLRALALGLLISVYTAAVVLYAPGGPLLHGFVLLLLLGAWIWAPRVAERRLGVAVAAVAATGAMAVPVAGAMDRSSPVLDYRSWTWAGSAPTVGFDWNHSYEPLDWPREGTPLLDVRSDAPHYWRAAVLERFDGVRWTRSEAGGATLEVPSRVEGLEAGARREWFERTEVTVRELRSEFVVGPGSVQTVDGLQGSIAPDGTALAGEIPTSGQTYSVASYAPDPSADQMRRAPDAYATTLARYTTISLPSGLPITLPLRGEPPGQAEAVLERSRYGGVLDLARRLTRDAPSSYDAVKAVERHLQAGYSYTEDPVETRLPLRSFLLDDRAGYCQQFSGAMALLLRMSGIPSRVVSGFSPGALDSDQDGVFVVHDTDAHSWTEVYFMGIGWVPFDPTPSVSPASSQTARGAAAATPGDLPGGSGARAREPESRGATPDAPSGEAGGFPWKVLLGIPLLASLGLLVGAVALIRRRARFRSLSPAERAEAQVRELAGALERARYRSGHGATLLALERQLRRGSRPAAAAYAGRLRAFRFSRTPGARPGMPERRAARRELGGSRGLRHRVRVLAAMPPGAPAVPRRAARAAQG